MYVTILWPYSTYILVNRDRLRETETTCKTFTCQPQLYLRPYPPTPLSTPSLTTPDITTSSTYCQKSPQGVEKGINLNYPKQCSIIKNGATLKKLF